MWEVLESDHIMVNIQTWLVNKGVAFEDGLSKAELLEIAKKHKQPKAFELDRFLESRGHLAWLNKKMHMCKNVHMLTHRHTPTEN